MLDIGFWELGLIALVALVVIGPERLPAVARTVGKWVGSMQRFVGSVRADIDAEINKHEDLKQLVEEQKELQETHEILEQTVSDLSKPTAIPSNSSISDSGSSTASAPTPGPDDGPAATGGDADNKQSHG